jgi:hypothetical protein
MCVHVGIYKGVSTNYEVWFCDKQSKNIRLIANRVMEIMIKTENHSSIMGWFGLIQPLRKGTGVGE